MNANSVVLMIAEKIREIATRQGNVPFLTGDLRKSVVVHKLGEGEASVGSNLPYARAVHDGRPALTIRPKNKQFLKFEIAGKVIFAKSVRQPARQGRPFIINAWQKFRRSEWNWLEGKVGKEVSEEIRKILSVRK